MKLIFALLLFLFGTFLALPVSCKLIEEDEYRTSILQIMEDDVMLNREKRETASESSGLECFDTDAQMCKYAGNLCECTCKPGYYNVSSNNGLSACSKVKTFTGEATFNETYNDTRINQMKQDVESSLKILFENDTNFVDVSVISLRQGSIIASYVLYYKNNEIVNVDYVRTTFQDSVNCISTAKEVGNLTVNLNESCNTIVGSNSTLLCDNTFSGYCDSSTTTCTANTNGYVSCPCLGGYYEVSPTVCQKQVCTYNSHCNGPFGWCTFPGNGINECICMWGFSGTNCYQPWMFTLTVVAAGCGLIIIGLIIGVVYCSKKSKKTPAPKTRSKHYKENLYTNTEPDIKYSFADFQPGLMRAKVPSTNDFTDISFSQEMKSPNRASGHSRTKSNSLKNGHANQAYETTQQPGSSTFSSPKRSSSERDPAEFF